MSLRREVAPKGMTFNANDFFISDNYATILTVISYPGAIYPGYVHNEEHTIAELCGEEEE